MGILSQEVSLGYPKALSVMASREVRERNYRKLVRQSLRRNWPEKEGENGAGAGEGGVDKTEIFIS